MRRLAGTLVAAAYCTALHADTRNTTFAVTATVTTACSFSGTPLAFGMVDPLDAMPVDGTATLIFTCTQGSAYAIGLGAGAAPGATTSSRRMNNVSDGSRTLSYSLSAVAPGGANWGTFGEPGVARGRGTGSPQAITVHGRIPPVQASVSVGSYSDILVATIDF